MNEVIKLALGIFVLILGIPIGNVLASNAPEELKDGRKWFYLIILVCFVGAIVSLIIRNYALLFTFLFITIVHSRRIKKDKKEVKRRRKSKK